MKTIIAILILTFAPLSFALTGDKLGVVVGNPSGLNGQYNLENGAVIDATAGWELVEGKPDIIINYYKVKKDKFYLGPYDLDFYYGGGVKLKNAGGITGSVSAAHPIDNQRLEVFGTAGLSAYVFGGEGFEADAYLGIRYLF